MFEGKRKIMSLVEDLSHQLDRVVVIGASTGGPSILEKIINNLSSDIKVAVVIAQHMPQVFVKTFVERLNRMAEIEVTQAYPDWELKPGVVYFVPGDCNIRFKRLKVGNTEKVVFDCFKDEGYKKVIYPSIDKLFISAAEHYGKGTLGIVLSGMGFDGREGACAIKRVDGKVIIQDKESSLIYGMPGEVKKTGCFDESLTPEEIITIINTIGKI